MESSPSKRRKTSPITSIPVNAPTTPSRIPVRKDGVQPLSGRPSFASPTKASIARHNPQLLRRPSSAGAGTERQRGAGFDFEDASARLIGDVRPSIEVEDRQGTQSFGSTTQGSNDAPQETTAGQPNPRSTRSTGRGLFAKPRRMSQSPSKQASKRIESNGKDKDAVEAMQESIDPFRKTGLRRSPVISGSGGVLVGFQENINPFQKVGLRRSPVLPQFGNAVEESNTGTDVPLETSTTPTNPLPFEALDPAILNDPAQMSSGQPLSAQPVEPVTFSNRPKPEEPELPLTPTQRGLADPVVTTPPTGIHNTPSRRARKNKGLAQKLKSSPLKPGDAPPLEPAQILEPELPPNPVEKKAFKPRKSARFLVPEDPYASKKKARDDLLKEVQQLRADVALANRENERLRLQFDSKKSAHAAPSNPDVLLDMLLRSTAPEPPANPKPKPASIFKSITSFLPFSSKRNRQPVALPSLDNSMPSHLPMALDDPLPYLQAFSPLTYTSSITLLPSEPSSQETERHIVHRHLITASHHSGLFSAKISMTVDSSLLSISTLDIEKLSPSAEKELGTFMRERCDVEAVLNRGIEVVCWAMGRWVEVSVLRARFWCTIETEFGNAEARVKSLQRKSHKRKRKRPQVVDDNDDNNMVHDGNDEDEEMRKQTWTRRQLLPHMGRTSMELSNEDVQLRFEWKIGFDWTGEVDNSISASARMPKSWQALDDRNSLNRIPESFDKLVKERGPLTAVRTVVGLLMPA